MEMYWRVELVLSFFTLSLDGDEWSASRPGHFASEETDPNTHWIAG
jgi:hypothetical protein